MIPETSQRLVYYPTAQDIAHVLYDRCGQPVTEVQLGIEKYKNKRHILDNSQESMAKFHPGIIIYKISGYDSYVAHERKAVGEYVDLPFEPLPPYDADMRYLYQAQIEETHDHLSVRPRVSQKVLPYLDTFVTLLRQEGEGRVVTPAVLKSVADISTNYTLSAVNQLMGIVEGCPNWRLVHVTGAGYQLTDTDYRVLKIPSFGE